MGRGEDKFQVAAILIGDMIRSWWRWTFLWGIFGGIFVDNSAASSPEASRDW